MFFIRGGDGKQYGPASTEQVLAWYSQHRVDRSSLLLREGETGWRPLGSFAEFAHVADQPSSGVDSLDPFAREEAQDKATPPAWGMIISGVLGVLWCLFQLITILVSGPMENPAAELFGLQQTPADQMVFTVAMFATLILGVAWAGFIVFAGTQFRKLRRRGVIMTACILMMLPCCGTSVPVCFISLPVGIWSLVILNQAAVRDQFRKA